MPISSTASILANIASAQLVSIYPQILNIINNSSLLASELQSLQTAGRQVIINPGNYLVNGVVQRATASFTDALHSTIVLAPVSANPIYEQDPVWGQVTALSPAQVLVGVLSHEVGHALDAQLSAAGTAVVTELLSEAKAVYNNVSVDQQEVQNGTPVLVAGISQLGGQSFPGLPGAKNFLIIHIPQLVLAGVFGPDHA
jgi:hypothetical protein